MVREIEVNFKDGARGFVYKNANSPDGRQFVVTRIDEVLVNKAKVQYDFDQQDGKLVLKRTTAFRSTQDGQAGTRFSETDPAAQLTTFYRENGQAVQATVQVNKSGFVFCLYEGLEPGRETKVLQENYLETEADNNGDPYGY